MHYEAQNTTTETPDCRAPEVVYQARRRERNFEKEFNFQNFNNQCPQFPNAHRVLLKEKMVNHNDKHDSVPTFWEHFADIKFRISVYLQKTIKSLNINYLAFVL